MWRPTKAKAIRVMGGEKGKRRAATVVCCNLPFVCFLLSGV